MNNTPRTLTLVLLITLGLHTAASGQGSFVFSTEPIDPASPGALATTFSAGDHIYGLIQMPQSWRTLGKAEGKDPLILSVYTTIDAKRLAAYMELRSDQWLGATYLLFDVAPALERMTAYRDEGVFYGDAPGGIKKGACQITEYLAQLSPGKHVLAFWVLLKGQKYATSEITIEGADYSTYETLHAAIKKELSAGRPFPAARKTSDEMEAKMVSLLEDAGWSKVIKLHIVDADWWIDRVAGGDSAIQSRHMAAAAAYQDAGGDYYYKTCTFHEQMLLTGGYGPLHLTHESAPVPISAESLGEIEADTGPDLSEVAPDDQPDFSNPDEVLADIERMRVAAMKKKNYALVGQCGTAASKCKRAVEKDPEGCLPEVKRIWLSIYEEFSKLP